MSVRQVDSASSPSEVSLLPGCLKLTAKQYTDARGKFVKLEDFVELRNSGFIAEEIFWSDSRRDVLRGMHFQTPPFDGGKLVWVTQGAILDAALDLRRGSPTYLSWMTCRLTPESGAVFLAAGVAHGFLVLEGDACVGYAQSCTFSQEHDAGIRWSSFGMSWPCANPILSDRDKDLPSLALFESPFEFLSPNT